MRTIVSSDLYQASNTAAYAGSTESVSGGPVLGLRSREMRVGLSHLAPRIRAVVEDHLKRPQSAVAVDVSVVSPAHAQVVLFDRCSDLAQIRRVAPSARTLFLRESPTDAALLPAADAVLAGRVNTTRLLDTLVRLLHVTPAHQRLPMADADFVAQQPQSYSAAVRCNADELLQRLATGVGDSSSLYVQSAGGQGWLLDPAQRTVRGNPLAVADIVADRTALFTLVPRATEPLGAVRDIPYDQWLYWLARFSSGVNLLRFDDDIALTVQRGVASPTHGRDFARLTVIYSRPLTVAQAADLARTDRATVRRFLNASLILNRVATPVSQLAAQRAVAAPAPESASDPLARSGNLFSRLLNRIRGGHAGLR